MNIIGIIPARYESSRFPGKPLVDIKGKSMIQRVYEQVKKAKLINEVWVATDDDRIKIEVEKFGGNVLMTSKNHPSGTDRINEAHSLIESSHDFVINIQGDEPFIAPNQIDELAKACHYTTEIATLVHPLNDKSDIDNPNQVKVTKTKSGKALYFSRSVIPYERNNSGNSYYGHIGMYAYRVDILEKICQLTPSDLETTESLEQLRWLENDFQIQTVLTHSKSIGIDTPDDLERAIREYL